MTRHPSGAQYKISQGDQQATLVEVGGGIRRYSRAGRDILEGYSAEEICTGARGTPLIPWPNRLANGVYTFEGTDHQVALTEPEKHNAIHGFLRWRNWTLRDHDPTRAVLGTVLHPLPGYPFTLDVAISYVLDPTGLTVTTTATNLGDSPCPYGAGQHPYLAAGSEFIDPASVTLDAATWIPTDDRGLPTAAAPVEGSPLDFRRGRRLGDMHVDNAFTDLTRDAQGRAWVQLDGPDGRRTRLWVDEHHRYLELYTGDTQPPERRRRGLGVEPMTCAPNGFASGAGLIRLDPAQTITTRWGIQPG